MVKSINITAVTSLTLVYLAAAAPLEKGPSHTLPESDDGKIDAIHPILSTTAPRKIRAGEPGSEHFEAENSFDEIGPLERPDHIAHHQDVGFGRIYPAEKGSQSGSASKVQADGSSAEKRDNQDSPEVNVVDPQFSVEPVGPDYPKGEIDPGFSRPVKPPPDEIDPGFSRPVKPAVPKEPRAEKRDNQDPPEVNILDPQFSMSPQGDNIDSEFSRKVSKETVDPDFSAPTQDDVPKQPQNESLEKRQDSPSMLQPEGPFSTVGDNISPNNRDATGWADDAPHGYYIRPEDNPIWVAYRPQPEN